MAVIREGVYVDLESTLDLLGAVRVFHDGSKDPENHRWFVDVTIENHMGRVRVERLWFKRKYDAYTSFVAISDYIFNSKTRSEGVDEKFREGRPIEADLGPLKWVEPR